MDEPFEKGLQNEFMSISDNSAFAVDDFRTGPTDSGMPFQLEIRNLVRRVASIGRFMQLKTVDTSIMLANVTGTSSLLLMLIYVHSGPK